MKNQFLIFVFLCCNSIVFSQTPFTCGGEFYLTFYKVGAITSLNEVEIMGNGAADFTAIGPDISARINSVGYRVTDNFIYGLHPSNDRLYRIDATGTATELAQIALTNNNNYVAGDVTPDGNYLVVVGKEMNNPSNELVLIDLNSPTYETTNIQLIDYTTGLPNSTVNIADIAFNPFTGICYAYDSINKRLVTIDVVTGEINSTLFQPTTAAGIGAVFFDQFGQLWGYGRYLSSTDLEDLIFIDIETGATSYVTTGPSTNGIDGCSCPYTIDLGKEIVTDTIMQCESFDIIYSISNLSGVTQSGIDLEDILPENFIIEQIVKNPFGGTVTGVGTNQLNVNELTLPIGIDSIIITVNSSTALVGDYSGQAQLIGLPDYLGNSVDSDNLGTFPIDDATNITLIEGVCNCSVILPNAFTPDGDGVNDYFSAVEQEGCTFFNFQLVVYNRWGELVYETDSYLPTDFGWNGKKDDTALPSDVYVWVVKYQGSEGEEIVVEKGDVTLIR